MSPCSVSFQPSMVLGNPDTEAAFTSQVKSPAGGSVLSQPSRMSRRRKRSTAPSSATSMGVITVLLVIPVEFVAAPRFSSQGTPSKTADEPLSVHAQLRQVGIEILSGAPH